ncbi:MAG: hypothetical protein Q7S48_03960 [bacterium]|nr:hypothetical protein [bacterium]
MRKIRANLNTIAQILTFFKLVIHLWLCYHKKEKRPECFHRPPLRSLWPFGVLTEGTLNVVAAVFKPPQWYGDLKVAAECAAAPVDFRRLRIFQNPDW